MTGRHRYGLTIILLSLFLSMPDVLQQSQVPIWGRLVFILVGALMFIPPAGKGEINP